MVTSNRNATGYLFMGIYIGAALAMSESASRRSINGDIRSRATGGQTPGRQSIPSPGTPSRHGADKFKSASNNYTAESSITVRNRPTRPPAKATGLAHGPAKFKVMSRPTEIIWGPESTE